jgi:cytochrome c biogenesis protein CcmG, thiol:disulfide interchange protein DsbE
MHLRHRLGVISLLLAALAFDSAISAGEHPSPESAPDWPLLDRYAGKVVLVDFWASWCVPCLRSFPWMNDLQRRHGAAGLIIVAVNLDHDRQLADDFLKKTPANFHLEFDAAGGLARQFGVQAMPTSFLIDRRGKVRIRHAGFRDKQRMERERQIEELLKESPT